MNQITKHFVSYANICIFRHQGAVIREFINNTVHRSSTYFRSWSPSLASLSMGDGGGTVVKVMCYKSEGRWFGFSLT